jgi:hypothetical protein
VGEFSAMVENWENMKIKKKRHRIKRGRKECEN